MPPRRTKRGAERTPIGGDYDVIVCGASFAGLAVARELTGMRRAGGKQAQVLVLDRYELGDRQTSACAAPTAWLEALGVERSILQTFHTLVVHTPHATTRLSFPYPFSTFDYPALCSLLSEQNDAEFEIATVTGGADSGKPTSDSSLAIKTDRGELRAPFVVDALGWRRVLGRQGYKPPEGPLMRAVEVHPGGSGENLEVWLDPAIVPAGYAWSFPARNEVRVGVASYDPEFQVRRPTVELVEDLGREAVGYQGNWIPHRLRDATENGVFFVGDSAGHCFPLTAEGIRPAFYFGIACGREIRRAIEGRCDRVTALRRYHNFSARHEMPYRWMLRVQKLMPRIPIRARAAMLRAIEARGLEHRAFNRYLKVAHPSLASAPATRHSGAVGGTVKSARSRASRQPARARPPRVPA
jgi:flavin-dependent dehydrogenase